MSKVLRLERLEKKIRPQSTGGLNAGLLIFSVVSLLIYTQPASALPSLSPRIDQNSVKIGLQTNTYLTHTAGTVSEERIGNFGLKAGARGQHQGSILAVEGETSVLLGLRKANYRYISVPEAFASTLNPNYKVRVGRHLETWSSLDDYWTLGLWQPRFRWDYLEEETQGLTGVFFTYYEPEAEVPVHLTLFGTPISIPEQSAPFDIVNGNCKTSSPWFDCPASSVIIFNQPTEIKYRLDIPPISSLVSNWGAGAALRLGSENSTFARFSYAYKPMNQVLLAYEGRLDLSTLALPAVIHPRIVYHEIATLEGGHRFANGFRVLASITKERPIRDYTPPDWNTQEAAPAWISGILARLPVSKHTSFEASVLHRDGGNAEDQGQFVGQVGSVFEPRYSFHNALSATVRSSIMESWIPYFLSSARFVWDHDFDGNILSTDFRFLPQRPLRFQVGFDILGSRATSNVDFIARYQRNDRIRGGVEYVF